MHKRIYEETFSVRVFRISPHRSMFGAMNPALNVRLCTRRARNVIGSSPVSTTHTLLLPIPFTGGGGVAISFNARIRAVFPRGNPISPPSMKESRNLWPHLHEAAYISSFRGIERRTKEKRRRKKKKIGSVEEESIRRSVDPERRALDRLESYFAIFDVS